MFLPIFSILIILSYTKIRPAPPQPSADNLYWDLAYTRDPCASRHATATAFRPSGALCGRGGAWRSGSSCGEIEGMRVSKLYILLWIDLYYMLTLAVFRRENSSHSTTFSSLPHLQKRRESLEYVRLEFLPRNSHHHRGTKSPPPRS